MENTAVKARHIRKSKPVRADSHNCAVDCRGDDQGDAAPVPLGLPMPRTPPVAEVAVDVVQKLAGATSCADLTGGKGKVL